MRPIIAITPNITNDESLLQLNNKYCEAILAVGGLPIIITYKQLKELAYIMQGLLLTGGGDIDPLLCGEQPIHELGSISPMRDKGELELCKIAIEKHIPILGICRGCQILSIASGGSIYQDIYNNNISNIKHYQQAPKYYPTHTIEINKSSKLMSIYKKDILDVNSFHHQAVCSIGHDIIISARAKDNIIEAIEYKKYKFILGVQWHPEAMFEKYPEHLELFKSFIEGI